MHTPIELVVADRLLGGVAFKQKARFAAFTHSQDWTGACRLTVTVLATLHATDPAAPQGVGEPMTGQESYSRQIVLVADNNCVVNAETGAILAIRQGESETDWQAILDALPAPTMLQGDFFEYLRENGLPGTIRQMIEQHIQQADQMGRFA